MNLRPEYLLENTKKLENAGSKLFKKLDLTDLVQAIDEMSRLPNLRKEEIDKLYRNIDTLVSIVKTFKHYIDVLKYHHIKIDKNTLSSISICELQMEDIKARLSGLKMEMESIDYHTGVLVDARSTLVEQGKAKDFIDAIAKSDRSHLLASKEYLILSAQDNKKIKAIETTIDSLRENFCSFIFAVLEPLHACFEQLIKYSELSDERVNIRPKLKKCQTLIDLTVVANNAKVWKQDNAEFCLYAESALVLLFDVQTWIVTIKNRARLLFLPDNKYFDRDVLKLEEFEPDTKQYNEAANFFYNMMKLEQMLVKSKHHIVQTHESSIKSANDLLRGIESLPKDIAVFVEKTRKFPSGQLEDAKRHYTDGKKIKHCIDAHIPGSLKALVYNLTMAKVDCVKSLDLEDRDAKLLEINKLLTMLAGIKPISADSSLAEAVAQFLNARSEFKKQYPEAGKKAPLYRFFSQATTPSLSLALTHGAQTARDGLPGKQPARTTSDPKPIASVEEKKLRPLPREARFKFKATSQRDHMLPSESVSVSSVSVLSPRDKSPSKEKSTPESGKSDAPRLQQ